MQKGAAAGSEEHVPLPVLKTDRAPKSNGHKEETTFKPDQPTFSFRVSSMAQALEPPA